MSAAHHAPWRDHLSESGPRRGWVALVAFLLVVSVSASVTLALVWQRSVSRDQQRSFEAEAAGIASTVATSVQRVGDLTAAAAAVYAADPLITNAEFRTWVSTLDVPLRYPGVVMFGGIEYVQRGQLPRFLERLGQDPVVPGMPIPKLTDFAPAPTYCLGRFGAIVDPTSMPLGLTADFNLCVRPDFATLFYGARDSGKSVVLPFQDPTTGMSAFMNVAPVFGSEGVPATIAQRRARLVGWLGGLFDANAILAQALPGHQGFGITLTRSDVTLQLATGETSDARVAVMSARAGADSLGDDARRIEVPITADGAWSLEIAAPAAGGMSARGQGLTVLGAGLLLTALTFVLLLVLGRGRQRALHLVDVKTEQLRHQALHDPLTGLPNRALIMDRTENLLARARRDATVPAALFLDLDGFKEINDTLGHAAGDQLLCEVARRLQEIMRKGDSVGRLGGDEFVVLVEGAHSEQAQGELVAQRILTVLREPFALPGADRTFAVTASIGVAVGDRDTADDLLRDADIALYEAKASGRDRHVRFDQAMHESVHDRIELHRDLRTALTHHQLFLAYQPIADLHELAITGVEALVRWRHPVRGVLTPDQFLPLAEETGLIKELGRQVLDQACAQAAVWHAEGLTPTVSVNVGARQLESDRLRDDVALALQTSGLNPASLTLEITETSLMQEPELTVQLLHKLKTLGVRLTVDDFGTGSSSLGYLRRFPVDAIKVDRSFVDALSSSPEADALLRALVQLGKTLGLKTHVEGIEDEVQLSHVRQANCDSGQGHLFGEPMDAEAVQRLLQGAHAPVRQPCIPVPRHTTHDEPTEVIT